MRKPPLRERFEHSCQKSNYLIAAAGVYDNLTTIGCQKLEVDDLTTNSFRILPTSCFSLHGHRFLRNSNLDAIDHSVRGVAM